MKKTPAATNPYKAKDKKKVSFVTPPDVDPYDVVFNYVSFSSHHVSDRLWSSQLTYETLHAVLFVQITSLPEPKLTKGAIEHYIETEEHLGDMILQVRDGCTHHCKMEEPHQCTVNVSDGAYIMRMMLQADLQKKFPKGINGLGIIRLKKYTLTDEPRYPHDTIILALDLEYMEDWYNLIGNPDDLTVV